MSIWRGFLDCVSSLKLTLICLSAAFVLVLGGTLAQIQFGTHVVQQGFFQSMLVWWPLESKGFRIPVFPGGHLLGAVLLVNLMAAHLRRFRLSFSNFGMHLIHGGLIIMLAGGLFTDLFSVESQMQLAPGETKNYSEDTRQVELAIVDETSGDAERVVAIPESLLRRGGAISLSSLPFVVVVKHYYENSQLQMIAQAGPKAEPAANHGVGAQISLREIPRATSVDGSDLKSAVVQILPASTGAETGTGSPGTWLVSEALGAPQTFPFAGGTWRLEMRPIRYYTPFSLTLRKFTHERYPGTDIPKNFASHVVLIDPGNTVNRDVLIYMNHPLRYAGQTYYQAGFGKDDQTTILQVVHNPTFVAPYIACAVIGAGLLIQFGFQFIGFMRRGNAAHAK